MKVSPASIVFSISMQSTNVHCAPVHPLLPLCLLPAGPSPFFPSADTHGPPCPRPRKPKVQCVRTTHLSLHPEMIPAVLRCVVASFIDLRLGIVWDTQVGRELLGAQENIILTTATSQTYSALVTSLK